MTTTDRFDERSLHAEIIRMWGAYGAHHEVFMHMLKRAGDPNSGAPWRFVLRRDVDETGVSGTGIVAEGVMFSDGQCAMRWISAHRSTAVYESIADLITIHGHDGKSVVVWLDEPDVSE